MKKEIYKFLAILALGALVVFLSACGGGVSANGNPSSINELYLDHLGRIPVGAKGLSIFRMHNESREQFNLLTANIIPLSDRTAKKLATTIDASNCKVITAGQNCLLQADLSKLAAGSYLLEAILQDKNGNKLAVSQMIEIVKKEANTNKGIELIGYNGAKIIARNDGYHINLPVILHNNYESMITSQGKLECNHGFESEALCNWLIDGVISKENTVLQLSLGGYDKHKQKTATSYQLRVTNSIQANLLLSEIADIEIGTTPENSQTVVIYNSGNYTATAIEPSVSEGLTITDNQCSDSLPPGRECTFTVQVAGNRNGNGIVDVKYQSKPDGTKNSSSTGVLFVVPDSEAVIELTLDSGNIESQIFTTESRVITLDVVNSGTKPVSNISFEAFSGVITSATSDDACTLNGRESLAVGAHCLVSIRITPDSEEANMTLTASGSYQDGNGNTFPTIGTYTVPVEVWHNKPITFSSESRPYGAVIFTHLASKGIQTRRVTITNPNSFAVTISNKTLSAVFNGLSVNADACTNVAAGGSCQVVITDDPTTANMATLKEDRTFTMRATSPATPEKTIIQNISIPIRIIRGKVAWVSESALQGNFRSLYSDINDICTNDPRNPVWKDAPAKTVVFGVTKNNFEVNLPYINWNYATEFPSRPSNADYYHIPGQTLPDGSTPSPIYGEERYPAASVWNWDGNNETSNDPGHTEDFIWTADTLVNKINPDGSRNTPNVTLSRTLAPWVDGRHGICSRNDSNNEVDGRPGAENSFKYVYLNSWNWRSQCSQLAEGQRFIMAPACYRYIYGGGFAWPVLFIGNNAHPSTGSVVAVPANNNHTVGSVEGGYPVSDFYTNTTMHRAYWSAFRPAWNSTRIYLNSASNWQGTRDLVDAITGVSGAVIGAKLFPEAVSNYRVLSPAAGLETISYVEGGSAWHRDGGSYSRYGAGVGDILTLTAFAGSFIDSSTRGQLNFDSKQDTNGIASGDIIKEVPGTPWGWASCLTYRHFICVQE